MLVLDCCIEEYIVCVWCVYLKHTILMLINKYFVNIKIRRGCYEEVNW